MSDLLKDEVEKYVDMWTVDAYGSHSPGEKYVPLFLEMVAPDEGATIIDAGCGSGKGAVALAQLGFDVQCCDFTDDGLVPEVQGILFRRVSLWDDLCASFPEFFDHVYCCDVMEHIPVAFTMLVAARLLEVAEKSVFFSISFQPDVMGYWIGKPLHETVMPFVWWRDQLNVVGKVVQGRDLLNSGVFLVEPR